MAARIPAFEREPYRRELEVEILAAGPAAGDEPAWAVLDDTLVYPEGGGQPADRGRLGAARVLGARRRAGDVLHLLDRPVTAGRARLRLDWARRYDHMQQHTAQHLLTALALDRSGWATTAFHLGAEVCSIDLDTPPPAADELAALEEAAVGEIAAGRPVTARRVSRAEFERLRREGRVRSRRLPEDLAGDVRLVEIEGLDVNTCGGTHLASLAEIASVKLLSAEPARGGCRLSWVAGDRVRRRLAAGEEGIRELRRLFETSAAELTTVARLKLEQLRLAERRLRAVEGRWAEAEAARLAAASGPVDAHFDDVDGAFLQKVARAYSLRAGTGIALLTASGEGGDFFALAAGEASPRDLGALGRAVADLLEGRGGGSRRLFQGRAGSLGRRGEAVHLLSSPPAAPSPPRR